MARRILVINPNTSLAMTEAIKRSAERNKLADTELTFVNPEEGPEVIETYLDESLSALGALKIIAAERDHFDAFVIACGDDPGLLPAREITTKPVVGIGQSPMLVAPLLGRKFSILSPRQGDRPRGEDQAAKYRLADLMASAIPCSMNPLEVQKNRQESLERLVELGQKAIEEDGAEVLILCGAAFAGMHHELSEKLSVPVLEGISCAVKLAELLIDLSLHTTRVGQFLPLQQPKRLKGFADFKHLACFGEREVSNPKDREGEGS
jgi:allantoin racemase